jgi:O-acetyl-ADP-ribose deacetylase (regulator of RNase III)
MEPRIRIIQEDITTLAVDAIVNAANQSLLGGGGVDGAIHRAAGPELLEACRLLQGCECGEAKITPGFQLPASYVIHTVGPVWKGGKQSEAELLRSCYRNSLELALDKGLLSIAFPNISTGVYGFPKDLAAEIAVTTVTRFLEEKDPDLKVIFAVFDQENLDLYRNFFGDSNNNKP